MQWSHDLTLMSRDLSNTKEERTFDGEFVVNTTVYNRLQLCRMKFVCVDLKINADKATAWFLSCNILETRNW